jgi:CubicO group peptidase (beta-lactamase class C family)
VASLKPTVLSFFGNPYALKYFSSTRDFQAILIAYNNTSLAQEYLAQAIFAGIKVDGVLPVSLNENYPSGTSYTYTASRLKYTDPNEFDLPDTVFYQVDSIVLDAIAKKAMPGCQVFYAKNGKVIYNKQFGYETYRKSTEIKLGSVYDIASVTKIAATTICLMKMYETNQFDPTAKLSLYLEELKQTDKKSIRINQILAHQSGLHAWIPFYKETLIEGKLRSDLYAVDSSEHFSIKVADQLFLRKDYVDSIYQTLLDTPLYHKKKYRYSDLGYYWMVKLIKQQTGRDIDNLASLNYYKPLGMNHTTFNAWQLVPTLNVVPSENDKIYRQQEISGYVHDPGAAMLGGVSGHAGLFSNANDLGKLGQMLLNKGSYGGDQFFLAKTLDVFNKSYFKRKGNRRALGFDKPALKLGDAGPTCESASQSSFGHSGFTGTFFWIDPEENSVFVFLSNRTYPNQENKKLVEMNIRTNIQQVFYNVFEH